MHTSHLAGGQGKEAKDYIQEEQFKTPIADVDRTNPLVLNPLHITSCNFQEIFTCCLVYLAKGKREHVIDMQFALLLRGGPQSKRYTPQCICFPCDACVFAALDLYALHLQT